MMTRRINLEAVCQRSDASGGCTFDVVWSEQGGYVVFADEPVRCRKCGASALVWVDNWAPRVRKEGTHSGYSLQRRL